MRASIADFEVLEVVPVPAGEPARYLCRPPGRLAGADDRVEVAEVAVGEGRWAQWSDLVVRTATVAHPSLRFLLETGPDPLGPGAYLVSETAEGGPIGAPRQGPLEGPAAIAAVAAAARAAHALHEAGLAHGSISPSTVVISGRGPVLSPPRLDGPDGFALRAATGPDLVTVDPDLLRGEAPSRSSDIWSLGATLHLVLSDRELYQGIGSDQAVTAVQRVLFTRPEIDTGLPAEVAALVARCLHPDPGERPETAAEVAEALEPEGVGG